MLLSLLAGPAVAADRGVLAVVALRGPITPVCKVGVPCNGPAAGVGIVVRRGGAVVARATTGKTGRARVLLRPGRYAVSASYGAAMHARLQSASVTIVAGRTKLVRFSFDTGIR